MKQVNQNTLLCLVLWLILAFIVVRVIALIIFPLYDTTEARYGEIARLMFETGNWITPQFDYGVPFWGKPPLYTWASALSFTLMGVSEFSARLPHLLFGLVTLSLVYQSASQYLTRRKALLATLILTSSLGFIVSIGMVMTDSALLLSVTLAMLSFWKNWRQPNNKVGGYWFFVALALGMLSKGPVAIVLCAIPLSLWSLYTGVFRSALRSLPWGGGLILFFALTLPWYLMAEIESPGFLRYFIVGEHFERFVVSGWQGDLYGKAHSEAKGSIWLFWVAAAFPWSFMVLYFLLRPVWTKVQQPGCYKNTEKKPPSSYQFYLLAWTISPMLLFTLADNILPVYVLPGFSAMALWLAASEISPKQTIYPAAISLIFFLSIVVYTSNEPIKKTSQASLISKIMPLEPERKVIYWKQRPFSAQFYTRGKAKLLNQRTDLLNLLEQNKSLYLAIKPTEMAELQNLIRKYCQIESKTRDRFLFICAG